MAACLGIENLDMSRSELKFTSFAMLVLIPHRTVDENSGQKLQQEGVMTSTRVNCNLLQLPARFIRVFTLVAVEVWFHHVHWQL